MCYQSAAASGVKMIAALRHGILVLMFPPLLIFGGILRLAYSRRNSFTDVPEESSKPDTPSNESEIEISLCD